MNRFILYTRTKLLFSETLDLVVIMPKLYPIFNSISHPEEQAPLLRIERYQNTHIFGNLNLSPS